MGAVSVDQEPGQPASPGPVERRATHPVLLAYKRRMRRLSLWYGGAVVVIAAVVIAWVAIVMAHSEIAHATLHSARVPAPNIATAAPSATPQLAWKSEDKLAIGEPYREGTVITYSTHTVSGRNATTGTATWTYTRSDMTICEVVQEQGFTVAFFNREGNCDEVNAFTTTTGKRAWSRTLDSDSQPTNGIPTYSANQYTITFTTPGRVQAIEPNGDSSQGGLDRWDTAAPSGCRDVSSALGTNGVLIMQDCADGKYLLLRDAYAADKIDNNPNPKLQLWRVKVPAVFVPVSADSLISAYDPTSGNLILYGANGTTASSIPLASRPGADAKTAAAVGNNVELIWIDGHAYAVDPNSLALRWTAVLSGPPIPTASSQLFAAGPAGVLSLAPDTGAVAASYPLPAPTSGSVVVPIGTGFLVGRGPAGGGSAAVYK
jgi:hypothetical protein